MIQVTLTFGTYAEAAEFFVKNTPPGITAAKYEPLKPDPKPTPAPSQPAATAAPTPAPTPAPTAAPTAAPAAATSGPVPYEKSGLPELIQKAAGKDRAGAVALLAKFGAKRGQELKSEQFEDFRAAANEFLAG